MGRKKGFIVTLLLLILVVAAGFFLMMEKKYAEAGEAFSGGQYEAAVQSFEKLGSYRDSTALKQQAVYAWSEELLENKQYDMALQKLAHISEYENAQQLKQEVIFAWAAALLDQGQYDQALQKLEEIPGFEKTQELTNEINYRLAMLDWEKGRYEKAYQKLDALSGYGNADAEKSAMILEWAEKVIESRKLTEAVEFASVKHDLTEEESRKIYDWIVNMDWSSEEMMNVPIKMLSLIRHELPEAEELYMLLSEYDYTTDFIDRNREKLEQLWSIPLVQNIVKDDFLIAHWMMGKWKSRDGKFIEIYHDKNDPQAIMIKSSFPWVKEPEGMVYFYIKDAELVYTDENDEVLALVFGFDLKSPDEMDLFCGKNQKTYSLTRDS